MTMHRVAAALALALGLSACAVPRPPAEVAAPVPAQWQSPLPHGGRLEQLAQWWQQWNDPLLVQVIDAAQQASPSLAAARARLAQAQAARVGAEAVLLPQADASASVQRGNNRAPLPLSTLSQAGLRASWEIDLFGGARDAADAAQARLQAAHAGWHEARVSVAAEAAGAYVALRACGMQLAVAEGDAASRAHSARLTGLMAGAGFRAPADAALAQASAAEGAARLRQQRAQCESELQGLAALTGTDAGDLRTRLARAPAPPVPQALFSLSAVPAQVLAQRPDLRQAALAVAAASADAGAAGAAQWPRLSLTGSIGAGRLRAGGGETDVTLWGLGPLALSVPVFDAGQRAAQVDAARARYDEAVASWQARTRQAVAEVEQALLGLDSAVARIADARTAAEGFTASFTAIEARQRLGLASQLELEDARRAQLAAQTAVVALQRELQQAWINLYRAAGGGWRGEDAPVATAPKEQP